MSVNEIIWKIWYGETMKSKKSSGFVDKEHIKTILCPFQCKVNGKK